MAARLGYDYVDITTYSYEFAKDQYDSSGFVMPQDDEDSEEDIEINNDSESAEIESELKVKMKKKLMILLYRWRLMQSNIKKMIANLPLKNLLNEK